MSAMEATLPVMVSPHMNMRLNHFVNALLSRDRDVKDDIKSDTEIRRRVTWIDLLRTQGYVAKALIHGPRVKKDPPLLFMVGGNASPRPARRMTLFWTSWRPCGARRFG